MSRVQEIVDTDRYPIHRIGSETREALVERCRADLREKALCSLPGFIRPSVLDEMMADVEPYYPKAVFRDGTHNFCYTSDVDASFPENHPARIQLRSTYAQLRNFDIPNDSLLRTLYMWEPLTDFVRDVFGSGRLYRSQCPHLALSLKIEGEGDVDNWHYDGNDGVISILLQSADQGGEFEYAPYIRTEEDECFDDVAKVIADPDRFACRPQATPGTFTFFNGELSLHRVRPVGPTVKPRVIALLCYDQQPNQVYDQSYVSYLDRLPRYRPPAST